MPEEFLRYTSSSTMVIWLVRLRIMVARPMARGVKRFKVGPSLTYTLLTTSVSTSISPLFSALATADLSSFLTTSDATRGVKAKRVSASPTGFPRMRSATNLTLRGAILT